MKYNLSIWRKLLLFISVALPCFYLQAPTNAEDRKKVSIRMESFGDSMRHWYGIHDDEISLIQKPINPGIRKLKSPKLPIIFFCISETMVAGRRTTICRRSWLLNRLIVCWKQKISIIQLLIIQPPIHILNIWLKYIPWSKRQSTKMHV